MPYLTTWPGLTLPDMPLSILVTYGRRVCPGRYMAEHSLFIAVASILQNFDITPARDSSGKEVMPEYEWTSGAVSSPTDYKCTIKPRSKAAEERILSIPAEV
ncbi:hypothetical protein M422DRAFT_274730 [Sphaerobolus stellatus SS14]|uniref:Cytochrome P450 n=1 Tax=Sphaerobolus stellatus (strain SS14) TaxID=990650 RepID=A0A0C9TRJ0_SPHS4|nr:hypothetical protein M422DRAFT_274730 [Sphaerobolus stellatus SS14]